MAFALIWPQSVNTVGICWTIVLSWFRTFICVDAMGFVAVVTRVAHTRNNITQCAQRAVSACDWTFIHFITSQYHWVCYNKEKLCGRKRNWKESCQTTWKLCADFTHRGHSDTDEQCQSRWNQREQHPDPKLCKPLEKQLCWLKTFSQSWAFFETVLVQMRRNKSSFSFGMGTKSDVWRNQNTHSLDAQNLARSLFTCSIEGESDVNRCSPGQVDALWQNQVQPPGGGAVLEPLDTTVAFQWVSLQDQLQSGHPWNISV